MQEATLLLARNPADAEAHKNLGLALMGMNRFDGAIAEFGEALHIKGDYAAAHVGLCAGIWPQARYKICDRGIQKSQCPGAEQR